MPVGAAAALGPIRKNMWKHRKHPEQLRLFEAKAERKQR